MQNSPLIRSSTIFLSTGEWRVFHQVGSPANKVASFHASAERRRRPRLTTQVCWRWMTCLTPTPVTSKINTKCYVDQKDKNHVYLWLILISFELIYQTLKKSSASKIMLHCITCLNLNHYFSKFLWHFIKTFLECHLCIITIYFVSLFALTN